MGGGGVLNRCQAAVRVLRERAGGIQRVGVVVELADHGLTLVDLCDALVVVVRQAKLLVQGVGFGGERFVGVVGVGDGAVFGVGGAQEQRADCGARGVVESAGLVASGTGHGDCREMAQHVIGVGGGEGAAG